MSGEIGPMGQQNVPSPSFGGNAQMNPQMGPGNQSPQVIAVVQSNPPPQPHPPATNQNNQNPQQQQQMATSNSESTKLRNLITSLRETSRNFFLISAMNLDYNTQMDNFNKNLEQPPKLEKSLEDILALCNQIELCLRTLLECAIQSRDGQNYLPFPVSTDFVLEVPPENPNTKSYSSYLTILKKQVTYAKSIYDILSESVKQIKQTSELSINQQPPQHIQTSSIGQSQMHPTPTGQIPPTPMHP